MSSVRPVVLAPSPGFGLDVAGSGNCDDAATASTAAGFVTPSKLNIHAGSTCTPRSVLNEAVPNDTLLMTNGAGCPGPGVPSLCIASSAASLVVSGNPSASNGPVGSVG